MAGYRFLAYIPLWAGVTLAPRDIINDVWAVRVRGLFLGLLCLQQARGVLCQGASACSVRRGAAGASPRAFLACTAYGCEIGPKASKLLKEAVTLMPGCFILKGKKAISDHILITQKHENSQISFPS